MDTKYPIGTTATFRPKHGTSARAGQKCTVTGHGNGTDESGVAHSIKFEDGGKYMGAVFPQELEVIELGTE
jgi:hypothetical protein